MVTPIKFRSLTDQLYEYLSKSIVEGKITSGERLVENDLCHQFGISRSPLRECFRILESEGLIDIHARKGTVVRELTPKDIEDVFPVRATLEGLAARLAAPNIGEREIDILKNLIIEMAKSLVNNDIRSYLHRNFDFHTLFIKASNNSILEKTLKNLGKGLWLRIGFLYFQSPLGAAESNNTHRKIVKAFQKKDGYSAQKLVEGHIEHAKKQILISISQKDPSH